MSEPTSLDVDRPFPDLGHEAIRQWVREALAIGDDSYFLTDLLFSLLDGALAQIDELTARQDELTARLDAIEPATPTPPPTP